MTGFVDIGINKQTNDIAHEGGLIKYAINENEVLQRILTCLRRIEGEWFLDTEAGLPYFGGSMLGSKDMEYVKLIIRREILIIEGVKEINSLELTMDTKTKKVTVSVSVTIDEKIYSITETIQ